MNAKEYRRNARRYLVRARQMASPENRAILIDLASRWMRLAERFETTRPVQQQQQVQPRGDNKKEKT
jgi:spore coat protein CotF